jgi:hypothetical protein
MVTTPQIKLRDGSGLTTNLVFTTNQEAVVIEGEVGEDAADIQVSVNGAPFVSDPGLVRFDLPSFTVPNLDNYPSGLTLEPGENTILIRTIDIVGGVSGTAVANVTLVSRLDDVGAQIPTAIRVRRRRDAVDILVAKPAQRFATSGVPLPDNFRGFHFYASTSAAGATGYVRINEKLVTAAATVFEETASTISSEAVSWANTELKNLRVRVTDESDTGEELAVRYDRQHDVSIYTNRLRFSTSLEDLSLLEFVSFRHIRSGGPGIINSDLFSGVSDTDPLYYVATAVYFDPATGQEVETPYSQEVLGSPLIIDTAIRELPRREQFQVLLDYIRAIQRVNGEISLLPGSTTRDVSIDPFASEAERLYFLLDFVHKSQSFLTLLQVDDANNDSISDPVDGSSYKVALKAALGLSSNSAVQTLIDAQFDKLAGNMSKRRLPGRPAVGQVTFYTTTKPSFDITIPSGTYVSTNADASLGIPSIRYRVGGTYVLRATQADAYYNFSKKRYELVCDVVAETVGSDGNRPAGQIKNVSGVSGVFVTNEEATVFGSDRESNTDLAARAMLGFVSVDTGTEGGYASTTAEQIGVVKAKVVKSGDALMMRDYDPIRKKHIGGKVDIWVQGLRERQVEEKFAFTFEVARDIVCQILDAATLTFRVQDSRVTPNTPITEILDNLSQGFGVRNASQGLDYDLTGVQILDYQTFRLNAALSTQPVTGIDDVVTADYRFRVVNQFTFSFQPVRRVVSVTGEVSGALSPDAGYQLFKTEDPLLEGESTIAGDYLAINQVGGIPSGASLVVNDERHVLIGSTEEPLASIGINTKTLRVFSADRTVEYDGPDETVPDYEITEGTPTTPLAIVRTASSSIPSGATVSVDYEHDENFTVTYVINDLLQELQRTLNVRRHLTADVVVKQAVQNSVDIETTVQLKGGATKDKADPAIRSSVSLELNQKLIGESTAQSDVISAIEKSEGVAFSSVPMARMAYADGSRKLRETLFSSYAHVSSLDSGGNSAYLLTGALKFPTTNGGGLSTEHRGVFQDDEALTMASSLALVASASGQAYIIGSSGAVITGYSDPATLAAAGFTTAEAQAAELLRRTANHVVVSLAPPDVPTSHKYAASYVIRGDKGAKDIVTSGIEFADLGSFTLTFRNG